MRMKYGPTGSTRQLQELLEAARSGNEQAFGRLVEAHTAELCAYCYEMLGSLHDAEDAVQDTLLRAWRGLAGFEGRSSLRHWLYRIATNASLDLIARRPKRVLPLERGPAADPDRGPLAEAAWVEPFPDEPWSLEAGGEAPEARYEQREAVELAFIVALQHLPARQRAVLIMREVLGFSAREVADMLDATVGSVTNALRRARKAVAERLPEQSQQTTLRLLGDARLRDLVERYVAAWERGDLKAIISMLTEDARFSMPPEPTWYQGREAIEAFLAESALRDRWRFVPVRANGQVAFATYSWDAARARYRASGVDVLTLRGARVSEVTAFLAPTLVSQFSLPGELRASTATGVAGISSGHRSGLLFETR
jgi:RNA polymerase sigma-70 factor, ECF subfamily